MDGTYRRHLDGLRARLGDARSETLLQLTAAGLEVPIRPRAGMFLWAELPEGLDAAVVARHALDEGVVLAPGNVFSVSRNATRYLRFNASQSNRPAIHTALRRAMARAAG